MELLGDLEFILALWAALKWTFAIVWLDSVGVYYVVFNI